ncbi:hypothetical protein MRQ36_25385 [Micromonospora sp. R77]|uniref:hypothetical protein n=1 Tax=Micromonospora sp. R77 TaxID=2925836 RepID=UPI001F6193A5|nr:hypothetical protein [Micromonospora sp. R77]MCI4065708.1 hypothetical protein [Micromonospora sp. R77]
MTGATWAALAGLGAFHGLNPAMGWLFAVARGLQERDRWALLRALPPIAAGHLASVAVVAALVSATRSVAASTAVAVGGGVLLVGFGLWRLLSERHFRWAGMRLSAAQLTGWSFLMSSAHGAGLMLLPVLLAEPAVTAGPHAGHLAAAPAARSPAWPPPGCTPWPCWASRWPSRWWCTRSSGWVCCAGPGSTWTGSGPGCWWPRAW